MTEEVLKTHFMKEYGHIYDRLKPSYQSIIDMIITAAAKGKHNTDDINIIMYGIVQGFDLIRREHDAFEQP